MTQLWCNSNSTCRATYWMYIPSFKLISQSMLKKSPKNADRRTDGRHNTSRFSNGRIINAFSPKLWVFFTLWVFFRDDKKKKIAVLNMSWKICLRCYTNQITFLLLSLAEFIQRAINISTSYMPQKHKKPQWMRQLYMFPNFKDIYLITENNCSKEGTDCKYLGLIPLNTSFMTKLGLKVVTVAKWYIQSKWKCVSLSVMPRYIHN